MIRHTPLHILLLSGFATARLIADSVPLNFLLQPGFQSEVRITSSTGGQDTGAVVYSGNILADVEFDSSSLRANSINFKGGEVTGSDVDLNFSSRINFTGLGTYSTQIRIKTNQIKQRLISRNKPTLVDPDTQQFLDSNRIWQSYEGSTSFTITVLGQSQTTTVHYQEDPEDGLGANLVALYSTSLSSDSWIPFPELWITQGVESLKKGSVGTTTIIFPSPYPSFIRFEVEP